MLENLPFRSNICLQSSDFDEAEAFLNSRIDQRRVTPLSANHHGNNIFTLQTLRKTQMFGARWGERVHIESSRLSTGHIVLPLEKSIYVNNLQAELKPNDLLLLTPGELADLVWDAGCASIVLTFDALAMQEFFGVGKEALASGTTRIIRSQERMTQALLMLFKSIDNHHEIFQGELETNLQKQWESMLFESCADLLLASTQGAQDILPVHIKRAVDWIMTRMDQAITVNELAAVACCSRRSLEQGFKQFVGMSPARFIIKVRLQQAREKLLNAEGSVGEVAFACGFTHLSYFSALYKDLYGETPSQTLKRRSLISLR